MMPILFAIDFETLGRDEPGDYFVHLNYIIGISPVRGI